MNYDYEDALAFVQAYAQDPEGMTEALREVLHEQESGYDDAVDELVAANPDIETDRFHQFVHIAGGNFDRAVELYRDDDARSAEQAQAALADLERLARRAVGGSAGQELNDAIDEMLPRRGT